MYCTNKEPVKCEVGYCRSTLHQISSFKPDPCVLDDLDILFPINLLLHPTAQMCNKVCSMFLHHFNDLVLIQQLDNISLPPSHPGVPQRVRHQLALDNMDNLSSFFKGGNVIVEERPAAHKGCLLLVLVRNSEIPSLDIPEGRAWAEADVHMFYHVPVVLYELLELVISAVGKCGHFLKKRKGKT